jgi:hypothetical protein
MRLRALLVFLISVLSVAQEFRGTVQGDVTDPSHSAVAGASVALKSIDTGIERSVNANETGHYVFTFVAPGAYTLSVKASGFKTTVREGIQLSINDSLRVDVEMALGQTNETVQVTGEGRPCNRSRLRSDL